MNVELIIKYSSIVMQREKKSHECHTTFIFSFHLPLFYKESLSHDITVSFENEIENLFNFLPIFSKISEII